MNFAEGAQTVSSFKFAGRLLRRCVRPYRTLQIPWPRPARHPRGRPAHPAREAPGRATCPASEPCRARAKVNSSQQKKCRGQQPRKTISSCPVGGGLQHAFFLRMAARPQLPGIALPSPRQGEFFPAKKMLRLSSGRQLSKVSANLPGRAAPARRHGGHAADVSHQLRSSVRFCRPLAPSCAGLAFDRRNRSNQIESHPKKKPWCGPSLQREVEVLVNFAEGAQTVSSFKFAGRVLRWRSPENLQILTV